MPKSGNIEKQEEKLFLNIRNELEELSEKNIAELNIKLCPNVNPESVLGIRIPKLREISKKIVKDGEFEQYIQEINEAKDNVYIEEIIIEGMSIGYSKIDIETKIKHLKRFVPKITNWLMNDTVCATLKVKKKEEKEILWQFILPYMKSEKEFEVRFAVITMLDNYITDDYVDSVISEIDKNTNTQYYAEMGIAWTLAEIGVKYNDKAMRYLKGNNHLDNFTFNKTLQKMRESYRVPKNIKEELKDMKRN